MSSLSSRRELREQRVRPWLSGSVLAKAKSVVSSKGGLPAARVKTTLMDSAALTAVSSHDTTMEKTAPMVKSDPSTVASKAGVLPAAAQPTKVEKKRLVAVASRLRVKTTPQTRLAGAVSSNITEPQGAKYTSAPAAQTVASISGSKPGKPAPVVKGNDASAASGVTSVQHAEKKRSVVSRLRLKTISKVRSSTTLSGSRTSELAVAKTRSVTALNPKASTRSVRQLCGF